MIRTKISRKYICHVPGVDECRDRLTDIYPLDKAKFATMQARQVKRIYESVMTKKLYGTWHIAR